jgi:hypothetical protein
VKTVRRGAALLLTMAAAALGLGAACRHRPARGTCVAHIDCAPGYDCRDHRCVKRPPIPGTIAAPPAEVPVAPASPPPPAAGEAPAPPAPPPEAAPPRPPPPRPQSAPQDIPQPPPERLPLWKERLKNS